MALSNTRDPQESARQLQDWLAGRLDGATDVRVTDVQTPRASGLSNETLLFTASWNEGGEAKGGEYVARVAPQGPAVFPRYDLVTEQRVMQALAQHTSVPVPVTPWVETDVRVLGSQFLVMERLQGRVAADDPPFTTGGWVLEELDPGQRAQMCDNVLVAIAGVHQADWRSLGLESLDRQELGETALDQVLADWRATDEWAREGDGNPTVEAAWEWLEEQRPDDEGPPVLVWGDARIGNVLVGDDLSVVGVLDWEMVSLGPPELDLAWSSFLLRHHTDGVGAPWPEGFPDNDAVSARYEELTGHRVQNLDYYEVLAGVRLSILMHRAGNLMVLAGLLPPDAPMKVNNPATQELAKLIGAPAPSGAAQSFIGNR